MRVSTIALSSLASRVVLAALDTQALGRQYFGNDAAWFQDRIPFFEISDQQIQDVYYYRWGLYRAHQRDLGQRGFISTEFLDDVGWQLEPWASLNDATGFHLGEGRWLRDRRYADDYINNMYTGLNDRHFTDYLADSAWGQYLVDGDSASLTVHLDAMINLYTQWYDHFDESKGLFIIEPLLDATEYTISSIDASGGQDGFTGGNAFRPTINSYFWANARAIANVADLAGRADVATDYRNRAATLKERFQADIWNTTLEHFIDRHNTTNQFVQYYEPIRGRELAGFVPWTFGMPDNTDQYNAAWKHLLDTNEFRGPSGMRTVGPTYEYYMRQYRYDAPTGLRECQWNGPVWPFQVTQVHLGLANLLNSYTQDIITKDTYLDELRRYTQLHYNNGKLDLEEDYEPDKPGPIVGLARSHHYFHSGYVDLIISGLIGIRPRADDTLEVNPLISTGSDITYFRLQDVAYHGHILTVQYDRDGSRYNQGAGLRVEIDGQEAATSGTLERVTAPISRGTPSAITRRIAKSTQLYRTDFPKGSVSSGQDAERIHDAIDGRVWFYPEQPQGWDSDATPEDSDQWYTIDFGAPTQVSAAELAFFVDGDDFDLPTYYDILRYDGTNWIKIYGFGENLIGNGIVNVNWDELTTNQIRVQFGQKANKRTRLAEFKIF
ncbi:F5/8 type C domain-containing protein [Elsinoe australis]|uniref:F5/8 type C domain-containing protein n=1 Tax=Elsinoe australis TaxID=40998 RepID=A0A4U7AYC6_9PEZI|nr:F5/8 type C domain-containing protein [Elsinoe australis]